MSAAKPTLKQISWRAVQDPRLASPLREIWGTPQCDAAFADLERSVCSADRSPENKSETDHRNSGMRPVKSNHCASKLPIPTYHEQFGIGLLIEGV